MIRVISSLLVLAYLLVVVASAQAADPINWPLSQTVIANDEARLKAILVTHPSQDELDFALIAGTGKGRLEPVRLLLVAGANPNRHIGFAGHSSIIVAVRENQPETLDILLQHHGDPNATDRIGCPPLHHTVGPQYEHPETIRVLVKHGAAVNARDGLQRTVLHRAAGFGHAEAVRALLALGADPALRDKDGFTALARAERGGHRTIAALLQKAR